MTIQNAVTIGETIAMNRQSGDTYAVKMKNSASLVVGIPIPSAADPEKFAISILSTDIKGINGIFEGYVKDIEYIEKR